MSADLPEGERGELMRRLNNVARWLLDGGWQLAAGIVGEAIDALTLQREEIARLTRERDEAAQQIYDSISKYEVGRIVEEEANLRASRMWAAAIEAAAKVIAEVSVPTLEMPHRSGDYHQGWIDARDTAEYRVRALAPPERAAEEERR